MTNKTIIRTKSGFTMGEILMSIAVLGALASITMSVIQFTMPDKYDAMYKKASYSLEHSVSEIITDDALYGNKKETTRNIVAGEWDGTYDIKIIRGLRNTESVIYDGQTFEGDSKFCELISRKFNIAANSSPNCVESAKFANDGGTPSLVSNDGVQWLFPISDFGSGAEVIAFKVSQATDSRAPHCAYISQNIVSYEDLDYAEVVSDRFGWVAAKNGDNTYYTTDRANCRRPDTFLYIVTKEGKLIRPEAGVEKVKALSEL